MKTKAEEKKGKQIIFHSFFISSFLFIFVHCIFIVPRYSLHSSPFLRLSAHARASTNALTAASDAVYDYVREITSYYISVVSLVSAHAHDPVLKVAGGLGIVSRQIIARCMSVHTLNLKANL